MAPVTNLGLLAFAGAALAVPHVHEHARLHNHRRGAPPVYGGSSAAPAYGGSSSVVAAASGSASAPAYGGSSAPAYGGSSSFVAPVSGSAIPSYGASASGGWSYPAGNSSWGWATGTAGATGYSGSGSISICTETSTLIYRTSTEYSTYYVTHTLTPESPSSVAAASVPAGSGPGGYPAGSAPAGSEAAACTPDVTVTVTQRQTVTVNGGGASGAPASYAAAGSSEAAIPSVPAKVHGHGHGGFPSKAPPAPESSAPAYSAPSSPESSAAPPAYSSGSAPSSVPSSSPSGGAGGATGGAFGGKRGLAYNDASLCDAFDGSKYVGWAYNWGSSSNGLTGGIPFVPMLWGTSSEFTDSWMANAKSAIAGGAPYLFSFNEPDMPSQANLSPQAAASAWKQYMEPFAGQAKLVAPSVTNSPAANQGADWLKQFLEACSDCTIDAVNQHWYDSAGNDMSLFKQQIGGVASSTGKDVFVTEFGFIGSDSEISSALETAMSYMDSNDSILGYSYFMVEDGILVNGNSLTSVGETYCNSA